MQSFLYDEDCLIGGKKKKITGVDILFAVKKKKKKKATTLTLELFLFGVAAFDR